MPADSYGSLIWIQTGFDEAQSFIYRSHKLIQENPLACAVSAVSRTVNCHGDPRTILKIESSFERAFSGPASWRFPIKSANFATPIYFQCELQVENLDDARTKWKVTLHT